MAGLTLSAFDVIGPVMVGPSSSHTAGAARIGLAARRLLDAPPISVRFGLHGSFAATGKGHATDRALLAGILGDSPDCEGLPRSFERAQEIGLMFEFNPIDLGEEAHPNSARIEVFSSSSRVEITAASLGGGLISINEIDGHAVAVNGSRPTLVCWHTDHAGFLAVLTALLAQQPLNIASITTNRKSRGGSALTVIEVDEAISPALARRVVELPDVARACVLPPFA